MKIATDHIDPNEPAFGIYEGPVDMAGTQRWVQDVKVIRGDRIAHYVTDFGPAKDFEVVTPLLMPSFGDDSVAELQAFAEKNRHDDYWQKRAAEMLAGSTLVADHIRQEEQLIEWCNRRSVYGPAISTQRNF